MKTAGEGAGMHSQDTEAGAGVPPAAGASGPSRFWNRGVDGLAALGTVMIVLTFAAVAISTLRSTAAKA